MIRDAVMENENIGANSRDIQKLKEMFPQCFDVAGNFSMETFKGILKKEINIRDEGYELNFLGKNYARMLASLETTTVIQPDEEHNNKPENKDSKNIYISGDNLDALKHMLKSYEDAVKCIYIDPPYNTGSDGFIYKDKFTFTVESLMEKLNISESEAERLMSMTSRGSASHSAWLTFMYPRLLLARDLLSKDGVIFISIDDNEQANLKLLCDSVFGEENFIANLVWEKKKKGSYLDGAVTNIKEYIFVYSRNKLNFNGLIGEINEEKETYPCINATNQRSVRRIPKGVKSKYVERDFFMKKGETISDTTMSLDLKSDLVIKNGVLDQDLEIEGNWRYKQELMTAYAENGELYITRDLYIRRIVNEPRYKGLKDLLTRLGEDEQSGYSYDFNQSNLQSGGWGSNEDADEEQRLLFGEQSLMSYPKPVLLIMKLLAALQDNDDIIVCDFFSGSATTAEAVLRSNLKGKKYRFINVQLPENLDEKYLKSSGDEAKKVKNLLDFLDNCNRPHTLDQLGQERIIRAAKKLREENPDTTADLGFKHYTLQDFDDSFIDKLDEWYEKLNSPQEILLDEEDHMLNRFGLSTVLATYLVHDGYGFMPEVQELDLAGYTAYHCGNHLYLIREGFGEEQMKALYGALDTDNGFMAEHIVVFGYSFTFTASQMLRDNLFKVKDSAGINKTINIDVRY